jgi:hypothetical protein
MASRIWAGAFPRGRWPTLGLRILALALRVWTGTSPGGRWQGLGLRILALHIWAGAFPRGRWPTLGLRVLDLALGVCTWTFLGGRWQSLRLRFLALRIWAGTFPRRRWPTLGLRVLDLALRVCTWTFLGGRWQGLGLRILALRIWAGAFPRGRWPTLGLRVLALALRVGAGTFPGGRRPTGGLGVLRPRMQGQQQDQGDYTQGIAHGVVLSTLESGPERANQLLRAREDRILNRRTLVDRRAGSYPERSSKARRVFARLPVRLFSRVRQTRQEGIPDPFVHRFSVSGEGLLSQCLPVRTDTHRCIVASLQGTQTGCIAMHCNACIAMHCTQRCNDSLARHQAIWAPGTNHELL